MNFEEFTINERTARKAKSEMHIWILTNDSS